MAATSLNPRTPGVYIEEINVFPPSVAQVETAIPAFIGYTEIATKNAEDLTLVPTRISSMFEYIDYFGTAQPEEGIVVNVATVSGKEVFTADFDFVNGVGPSNHNMFYALQQYFANGGGPCYIVSVGGFLPIGTVIADQTPYENALIELRKEDEPTLIVMPEGQNMDSGTYFTLLGLALQQCIDLGDRFVIMDLQDSGRTLRTAGDVQAAADTFRGSLNTGNRHLQYGAVYFPNIRSSFNYTVNETATIVNIGGNQSTFSALNNRQQASARLALQNLSIYLPPSSSIAGIYARVDSTRGVWKAPANEGVVGATDLTIKVTDEMQSFLNVDPNTGRSINAIRFFTGRGIKVWGARTLAGNDNEWRYVNVRRFFNMVEESVKKATEPFVFEPNDRNTWTRIKAMIENFLTSQWGAGALQGKIPAHAFYVKVGLGETMSALDILEGRLIVEIGMAVVRPAEFIILQFMHKLPES
jgi:uncharacterized protein